LRDAIALLRLTVGSLVHYSVSRPGNAPKPIGSAFSGLM
jgi:hypothetical protein